jgi:predicted O-methyltransferase YrrM
VERKPRHALVRRALEWAARQKPDEFSNLLYLVEEQSPATVLEIGTWTGGTLLCWCRLAQPDAVIVSVDLPGGPFGGGYTRERAEEITTLFPRAQQALHLIQGDSHDQSTLEQVRTILQRPIDFLFIDGDHSYEGVKQDFQMYSPLVGKDGLIVFHDIVDHPRAPSCKVHDFWNEIKHEHRHVEYTSPPWGWGGIGVLWRRDGDATARSETAS